MRPVKNILISGRPGVGKTTLIKKIAKSLREKGAGFYTEEIRREGRRIGFRITTLEGRGGVLAHMNSQSSYRVGRYKVNLKEFEEIAVSSIEEGIKKRRIIVIDEIGKMELYSDKFRRAVLEALESSNTVIATIPVYKNEFLEKIRQREDVKIYNVTRENREKLRDYLLRKLEETKI